MQFNFFTNFIFYYVNYAYVFGIVGITFSHQVGVSDDIVHTVSLLHPLLIYTQKHITC